MRNSPVGSVGHPVHVHIYIHIHCPVTMWGEAKLERRGALFVAPKGAMIYVDTVCTWRERTRNDFNIPWISNGMSLCVIEAVGEVMWSGVGGD